MGVVGECHRKGVTTATGEWMTSVTVKISNLNSKQQQVITHNKV